MQPLAEVEIQIMHNRVCRHDVFEAGGAAARQSAMDMKMNAFHAVFHTWLAEYGQERLPRLFACLPRLVNAVVRDAVWFNDLPLLQSLHELVDLNTLPDKLIDFAASKNHFELVKYLDTIGHDGHSSDAMDWASEHGNLALVTYLHQHGRPMCTGDGLRQAFGKAHLDVADYLLDVVDDDAYVYAVANAINDVVVTGRVDAVEFLLGLGARFKNYAIAVAALNGQLELVRWMLANQPETPHLIDNAIDHAAMKNQFEVVLFLLERTLPRDPLCSVYRNVMACAAGAGRLDMVQYIHQCGATSPSTHAMDNAAANGHLHVVQWLHNHRSEGCTQKAIDKAAANNHLDVVQWLQHHRQMALSANAMDDAAGNGHLDMVQWLHVHSNAGCTVRALDSAIANGHLEVAQWLHANRSEGCSSEALDKAASGGFFDVVLWCHEYVPQCRGTDAMLECAAEAGHVKMVKWILVHRSNGCPGCARVAAWEKQHVVTSEILGQVPRNTARECGRCQTMMDANYYECDEIICTGSCRTRVQGEFDN
ncbi:Aste57867_17849 [Aphanomyces stellatus]|uniref:Aste57867_17849 protein n=1 Tax=Aphanomyces stellatus TaxID=120398 RepID=A0A485L996_9STRA|nr:hypothetical protein As57867_017788 [Aphanomyces stellatus]VFT94592.1 Aste57867_17849 [Aphanomyces stellatus]